MSERLDRLEALAETILLAIQQQQQQRNEDRQEFRETIEDVVSMVAQVAETSGTAIQRIDEMQSEIRGLQVENRRMLDYLINQQRGE